MKSTHYNLALFAAATILSAFLATQVHAEILSGRVVGVADGDTVTVLDASNTQFKIRLLGIDAPEKKMPYGNKSKEYLSALVFNKQVTVEYSKKDRYGRTVGKIIVGGLDANLAQIKAGMAWHYKQYQREQTVADRGLYAQAEEDARGSKRGLWKDADPVAPWDWRKAVKRKNTAVAAAEWTEVAVGVDSAVVYADSATIIRSGNKVKMWSLGNFPLERIHAEKEYLSMKFWVEYDCKNNQLRQLSITAFSKNMGAGDIVYAEGEHLGAWSSVQPESINETLWIMACGRL